MVPFRYNEPLDSVEQVKETGIPFQPLDGTVMVWLAESDPRPIMVEMVKSGQGGNWLLLGLLVIEAVYEILNADSSA